MRIYLFLVSSLFLSLCAAFSSATEIVPTKGNWYLFDVDPLVAQSGNTEWIDAQSDNALGYVGDGSPLLFSFSVATHSYLNIVDAGISGDIFSVLVNGKLFKTSAVAADSGKFAGVDADYAWSLDDFSRISIFLAPGIYTVTGYLEQSAQDDSGLPYMASVGALQIVEADEPAGMLLLGLATLALGIGRRFSCSPNQLQQKKEFQQKGAVI